MSLRELPIINIQVEGIAHKISGAFLAHEEEVKEAVRKGVMEALDNMDLVGMAREMTVIAVEKAMRERIEVFFMHQEGRELIDKAIRIRLESN